MQEGVLLSETTLLDHNGDTLRDERFMHNDGQASVIDLTAGITTFAIKVATAFLKISDGDTDGVDISPLMQFIIASDEKYEFAASTLSKIIRSGLVSYARQFPLYIFAGKPSRRFTVDEDRCWALLGALELEGVEPWYNDGKDLAKVKAVFFKKLLEKYQWALLLVARSIDPDNMYDASSWPERVVVGDSLPLGIFFDVFWKRNLPTLTWTGEAESEPDKLVLRSKPEAPTSFIRLLEGGTSRRYQQLPGDPAFIRVLGIQKLQVDGTLFLPVADLDKKFELEGARCIEVGPVSDNTGLFRGIIDI